MITVLLGIQVVPAQVVVNLKEALVMAKKSNPDLKTSYYNIGMASADLITAKLHPNPVFNMQLLGIFNQSTRLNEKSVVNPLNTQTWYQVTKPFIWQGRRMNFINYTSQLVRQANLDYEETSRQVFFTVANQWLTVWQAKINLDLLNKAKTTIDSLVIINEIRYKDKDISSTELMRAQLLQEQYTRDIVNGLQVYRNEIINLKYLLGTVDSLVIDLNDQTFNSIITAGDSLVQLGLNNRSDVLAVKNAIQVSDINIKLQRSLGYPVPEMGVIWNPQNTLHYFGFYGTLAIPLFNRNQGERQKSEVDKLQNEQAYDAIQKQIETEVSTSYQSYFVQKQNIKLYELNLRMAENILQNVRYSYLKGGTTIIDFLEAQRSWLDTQQQYYNALLDFRRSYVQLLYSTGLINQIAE